MSLGTAIVLLFAVCFFCPMLLITIAAWRGKLTDQDTSHRTEKTQP
jgi:hypothetical protein